MPEVACGEKEKPVFLILKHDQQPSFIWPFQIECLRNLKKLKQIWKIQMEIFRNHLYLHPPRLSPPLPEEILEEVLGKKGLNDFIGGNPNNRRVKSTNVYDIDEVKTNKY